MYPETFQGIGLTDSSDWKKPQRFEFTPKQFRDYDIDVEIEACAVCGSDVHQVSGGWRLPFTPIVVGHEIVGTIVKIGPKAKKGLKLGDRVGIGAQADCDETCQSCQKKFENNCDHLVKTISTVYPETGEKSMGGNASHIRLNSKFAFKIPDTLDTKYAAPLLCGGITAFSPLLAAKVGKGTRVGVSGIGGIGHMAILFAKALGAEVTAISRNSDKEHLAYELGADHYAATDDPDFEAKWAGSLDMLLNTGSSFSGSAFKKTMRMLVARGHMTFITSPPAGEMISLMPGALLSKNLSVSGSAIGSVDEIQYMLDFAAEHNIKPWVECLDMNEENLALAWQRTYKGDVKFRFSMINYKKCFQ